MSDISKGDVVDLYSTMDYIDLNLESNVSTSESQDLLEDLILNSSNSNSSNRIPTTLEKIEKSPVEEKMDFVDQFSNSPFQTAEKKDENYSLSTTSSTSSTVINVIKSVPQQEAEVSTTECDREYQNNNAINGYKVLISNLTWWTTDADIENLLATIGITDVVDIRVCSSSISGQSKGFLTLKLKNEESYKRIFEKSPSLEIYNNKLQVYDFSKENYRMLELRSKTRNSPEKEIRTFSYNHHGQGDLLQQRQGQCHTSPYFSPYQERFFAPRHLRPPNNRYLPNNRTFTYFHRPNRMFNSNYYGNQVRNPHYQYGQYRPSNYYYPQPIESYYTTPPEYYEKKDVYTSNWNTHATPPKEYTYEHQKGYQTHPEPSLTEKAIEDEYNRNYEKEFNEILLRNRAVSSSAISKAIEYSKMGDDESSIDTLQTAISIIKHSRIAKDPRCELLIDHLKDSMITFESKTAEYKVEYKDERRKSRRSHHSPSASSSSRTRYEERERRKSRSRSRSRERKSSEHRSSYREKDDEACEDSSVYYVKRNRS